MFKSGMVVKLNKGKFKGKMVEVQDFMVSPEGLRIKLDDDIVHFEDVEPIDVKIFGVLVAALKDLIPQLERIDYNLREHKYVVEGDVLTAAVGLMAAGQGIHEALIEGMKINGLWDGYKKFEKQAKAGELDLDDIFNDFIKERMANRDCSGCSHSDDCENKR